MLLRYMQRYMLHNNEEIKRMIHDSDVRIASVEGKIRRRENDELRMLKRMQSITRNLRNSRNPRDLQYWQLARLECRECRECRR